MEMGDDPLVDILRSKRYYLVMEITEEVAKTPPFWKTMLQKMSQEDRG